MCHEDRTEWEFGFCDEHGLVEFGKGKIYVLKNIWTFFIKHKKVCLKIKFFIKENGKLSSLFGKFEKQVEDLENKLKT